MAPFHVSVDCVVCVCVLVLGFASSNGSTDQVILESSDTRFIHNAWGTIFDDGSNTGYSDQPQVIVYNTSYWLCVITCSPGHEGQRSQIAGVVTSLDGGRTWSSPPKSIEPFPFDGKQRVAASWINPLFVRETGRLFVFYTFNLHNTTAWPDGSSISNSNLLGGQFYRYSDNAGISWSDRFEVPIRTTTIDMQNSFNGTIPMGWSVGKPLLSSSGCVYFQYTKIGCPPTQAHTCKSVVSYDEAWLYASGDILSLDGSALPTFTTLPSGDTGLMSHNRTNLKLRAPMPAILKSDPMPNPTGSNNWIAEEGDVVEMGNFTPPHLYYTYRTSDGYLGLGTSIDGGLSFKQPLYAQYSDCALGESCFLKNPRGPITPRRFGDRYLLLYYNRGSGGIEGSRNPYWLTAGTYSNDTETILWSQPEIVLYAPYGCSSKEETGNKIGYPDMFESDGDLWITETDKIVARIHKVDKSLVSGLLAQGSSTGPPVITPLLDFQGNASRVVSSPFTNINVDYGASITIEAWIKTESAGVEPVIECGKTEGNGPLTHFFAPAADAQARAMKALFRNHRTNKVVSLTSQNLSIFENSSSASFTWHHVALVVDGAAQIASFYVDGVLLDGGKDLGTGFVELACLFSGSESRTLAQELSQSCEIGSSVGSLRVYGSSRPGMGQRGFLRTSEIVALYRAGPPQK